MCYQMYCTSLSFIISFELSLKTAVTPSVKATSVEEVDPATKSKQTCGLK